VAALFGVASFARDAILVLRNGYLTSPDTAGYLSGSWLRSRPYPVMAWLTDATHHPENLVWLQLVLGGVATAALVWVLWRNHRVLAVLVGVFFVLDFGWATHNRQLLSEGPFVSFSVLSLAALGYQYEQRHRVGAWGLALAGILFAWTCTIRPSNLYLLAPIAAFYFLFTRSWRKTAWLAAGMIVLLLASAWLTLVQTGKFRISGGTGYFVAFPLFSYQIFSPGNGPVSAQLDSTLRACGADPDYAGVSILTSNDHIWGHYIPCLQSEGWSVDRIDQDFTAAYEEAVPRHSAEWFRSWGGWFVIGLGYPPREGIKLAGKAFEHLPVVGRALQKVLPSYGADTDLYQAMSASGSLSWQYVVAVLVVLLVIVALFWWRTGGTVRVIAMGALTLVVYVCATVPAGHVFLQRYVEVLSPMHALVAAVLLVIAGEFLYRWRYRRR
jgi:hypothetical protein